MATESFDGNSEITDEEFQRIRSTLYSSATAQMQKIAKMVLNVADNLSTVVSNMNKSEDKILNVIERTDFLIEETVSIQTEKMEVIAS